MDRCFTQYLDFGLELLHPPNPIHINPKIDIVCNVHCLTIYNRLFAEAVFCEIFMYIYQFNVLHISGYLREVS